MEALRGRVTQLVDRLLDETVAAGEADAIAMLALRLPVMVIGEILAGEPARAPGAFVRGLSSLPVRLRPSNNQEGWPR